ncbi:MAG: DNA-3-methyladenine glycosylase [Deltaproteobacteria bacterium]|nr:DNA-3-methyladenine glycosylase [Deltaproteobacteria bacterium]
MPRSRGMGGSGEDEAREGTRRRLERSFFDRPALEVARELLGCVLVRLEPRGERLSGVISETEAYAGPEDLGCHARAGRTARNASLWGPPGHAYVYFTYGMHWLLNVVVEPEERAAAVLLRAIRPLEGVELMRRRRNVSKDSALADGPGKLCQALAIDGRLDGHDLCLPGAELFIEAGEPIPDEALRIGPRVGLFTVPEPWKSIPWRFRLR